MKIGFITKQKEIKRSQINSFKWCTGGWAIPEFHYNKYIEKIINIIQKSKPNAKIYKTPIKKMISKFHQS